ncbi:MAG: hypothetical protein ACJZ8E_01410 [Pseudohongiellaceae bacterium]
MIEDYDEVIREYYRTRTGGGHGISWSEQVAILLGEKSRPHMKGFLAEKGLSLNNFVETTAKFRVDKNQ